MERKPALFLGGLCLDLTKDTDHWPGLNEKHTSNRQVRCPGGGAGNASRCYRQLGPPCQLLAPLGLDGIGDDFRKLFGSKGIQLIPRDVVETPISIVRPKGLNRSLERDPDPEYVNPTEFPKEDPSKFRRLHLDGKEPEAALYHARVFRTAGLDVSLDANPRPNTAELLNVSTIVFASEKYFTEQRCSFDEFFASLRSKGVWLGGVTRGEKSIVWFAPDGKHETLPRHVREEDVQDTSGAGDGFEGALLASLDLWGTSRPWEEHIGFASTVGSMMVQQFGNKHFPTRENVESLMRCAPVAVAQAVA